MKVGERRYIYSRFNCGFDRISNKMVNINIQFYITLMLFILFDVELLFVYRFTCISKTEYVIIYLLITILIVSYLYEVNEGLLC